MRAICGNFDNFGALAQLGERLLCKHQVIGSIPIGSTTARPTRARAKLAATSTSAAGMAQPWSTTRLRRGALLPVSV